MKKFFDKYKYILGLGIALIAVVIIAIVSSAAGKNTAESSIPSALPETSAVTDAVSDITASVVQTTSTVTQTTRITTTVPTTATQTTYNSEKPAVTNATTVQTVAAATSTKQTSASTPAPITTTTKAASTTTKSTAGATTPKPDNKPVKKYDSTCTFVIECKTILSNKDNLTKGLEKYVPNNGIIYSGTVGFDNGESVYDILRRICDENKIQMEASFTPLYSSYYVEGINNLYEFDCGQGSGWMYSVNGVFPNYGCSSYKPVNNDSIAFRYTCELGYDL